MLSGFLTLSAQILASHLKSKRFLYVMRQNKVKRPAVTGNCIQDTWLVQPVLSS